MRLFAISFAVLIWCGCSAGPALPVWPEYADRVDHSVSLSLGPAVSRYAVAEVRSGVVQLNATITNTGNQRITIAHPSICIPSDHDLAYGHRAMDPQGKAEILAKIAKPDGTIEVLRDGPFLFDPGHVPYIEVEPKSSEQFVIGWFFPNERGRWEDSPAADRVFLRKGVYLVQLLLRNSFPNAAVYNFDEDSTRVIEVWTGEVMSNIAMIEVK